MKNELVRFTFIMLVLFSAVSVASDDIEVIVTPLKLGIQVNPNSKHIHYVEVFDSDGTVYTQEWVEGGTPKVSEGESSSISKSELLDLMSSSKPKLGSTRPEALDECIEIMEDIINRYYREASHPKEENQPTFAKQFIQCMKDSGFLLMDDEEYGQGKFRITVKNDNHQLRNTFNIGKLNYSIADTNKAVNECMHKQDDEVQKHSDDMGLGIVTIKPFIESLKECLIEKRFDMLVYDF